MESPFSTRPVRQIIAVQSAERLDSTSKTPNSSQQSCTSEFARHQSREATVHGLLPGSGISESLSSRSSSPDDEEARMLNNNRSPWQEGCPSDKGPGPAFRSRSSDLACEQPAPDGSRLGGSPGLFRFSSPNKGSPLPRQQTMACCKRVESREAPRQRPLGFLGCSITFR